MLVRYISLLVACDRGKKIHSRIHELWIIQIDRQQLCTTSQWEKQSQRKTLKRTFLVAYFGSSCRTKIIFPSQNSATTRSFFQPCQTERKGGERKMWVSNNLQIYNNLEFKTKNLNVLRLHLKKKKNPPPCLFPTINLQRQPGKCPSELINNSIEIAGVKWPFGIFSCQSDSSTHVPSNCQSPFHLVSFIPGISIAQNKIQNTQKEDGGPSGFYLTTYFIPSRNLWWYWTCCASSSGLAAE